MRKFISIMVALGLTIALAGCNSDKQPEPTPTPISEPTSAVTLAPTSEPTSESFAAEALSYYGEGSTELLNRVMTIYPVDDTKAVFQFSCYDATEDVEIPVETVYPFTFTRNGASGYIHTETDQNGDSVNITAEVDDEGKVTVTSEVVFPYDIAGLYMPGEDAADIAPMTLVEYLRNIPGTGIDDFGLYNPYDEAEDTLVSGWFHDLTLIREGEGFGRFLVADDLSVTCKLEKSNESDNLSDADGLDCTVLAGSFVNTLNHEASYDIYNEDEDTFEEYTRSIVYPYVTGGSVLTVGATESLEVSAPWELTESVECKSSDESIVAVADGSVVAKAPGEAILKVTVNYGGAVKDYELAVQVVEADEETLSTVAEYTYEAEDEADTATD